MRKQRLPRTPQRGAIAIIAAVSMVALIGMAGLVFDLGQMFVSRTELQNAADACALAAARELSQQPTTLAVLTRAENAGITTGIRNKMGFQDAAVTFANDRDVTFSSSFTGAYLTKANAPANSGWARCTTQRTGIIPWFMQVLGEGPQQVSATAVASLQGSSGGSGCNVMPLGLCRKPVGTLCANPAKTSNSNGLCKGQWYDGRFNSGGGATGNFNWLDFSPQGGGANELKAQIEGFGACNVTLGFTVHAETGINQSVETAWNSRFGLYKNGNGQPSKDTAPPDWTGFGYTSANWSPPREALGDFLTKRNQTLPYPASPNPYTASTQAEHASYGGDRRLVFAPIVNCAGWNNNHTTTVSGMACVLMVNPNFSPTTNIALEFVGQTGDSEFSLCGTFGLPGGPGGSGPSVPTLVQ